MNRLKLKGSWFVKAPQEKIYEIITDFEAMPVNFPGVAKSMKILKQDGNKLQILGKAKALGRVVTVKMETEVIPTKGFTSRNNSEIVRNGYEEFLMEEEGEGTRINYTYEIEIRNPILRIFAKPIIESFSMWRWKRLVIDRLKQMLED